MSDRTYTVRLFGPARDAAGAGEVVVRVADPATAGGVVEAVALSHPDLADLLPRSRVAVNRAYVAAGTPVRPEDEIAVLPPVGGG